MWDEIISIIGYDWRFSTILGSIDLILRADPLSISNFPTIVVFQSIC
jgi:hypothetical protein